MKISLLALLLAFTWSAIAENYKYNELIIKDYDEMQEMVRHFVDRARDAAGEDGTSNEDEAVGYLREALKLIFSRPNSDNMVAKLVPEVRRVLLGFNAYEREIGSLVNEAIGVLKKKNVATSVQSTSLFILDNILAEIRPEAENNAMLREVIARVRDAKLRIPKDVIKERQNRMFSTQNPSDLAKEILKTIEKREKAAKKAKKD